MKSLTSLQRQILDALTVYYALHGIPPTVRELGRIMGKRSSSTMFFHLQALERKGFIRKVRGLCVPHPIATPSEVPDAQSSQHLPPRLQAVPPRSK